MLLLFLIVAISPLYSEDDFERHLYVQGSAGYSFGFPSSYIGQEAGNSRNAVYEGLAHGFAIEAALGYMITRNLGIEAGLLYLAGSDGTQVNNRISYSADIPALMPSLVLTMPLRRTIEVYTKFGMCIAIPTIKLQNEATAEDIIYGNSGASYFVGGTATGLRGVVGIGVKDASTLLFIETSLLDMVWGPERLESNDGKTIIKYQEQITYPSRTSPQSQMQPRFDISTISLRAGIAISL